MSARIDVELKTTTRAGSITVQCTARRFFGWWISTTPVPIAVKDESALRLVWKDAAEKAGSRVLGRPLACPHHPADLSCYRCADACA